MGVDKAGQDESPGNVGRLFRPLQPRPGFRHRPERSDAVTGYGHETARDHFTPFGVGDDGRIGENSLGGHVLFPGYGSAPQLVGELGDAFVTVLGDDQSVFETGGVLAGDDDVRFDGVALSRLEDHLGAGVEGGPLVDI